MRKKKNIFIYIAILIYFIFIGSLIGPSRHVDPDFFQFLGDSQYYLNWQLPPFIQSLPGNPILLGVLSRLFANYLTEIEIALWINAVSISLATFLLYKILAKDSRKLVFSAELITLFVISHPIIFASAVSNNSEALFSLFMVSVFYLVQKKKIGLAVICSALGILIRYESAFIFGAIFLTQLQNLSKKNLLKIAKQSMVFAALALPILFALLTRNDTGSIVNTPFLTEVFTRKDDVPEWRFIFNFPFAIFYLPDYLLMKTSVYMGIVGFLFWLVFLHSRDRLKKIDFIARSAMLFSILFLVFHIFFPAYLERYFVPSIFAFAIFFNSWIGQFKFDQKSKLVLLGCWLFLVIYNLTKIFPNGVINPKLVFDNADYYAAQTIKQNISASKSYLIVSPYPETISYYYREHENINLVSINKLKELSECDDLDCAIKHFEMNETNKILIPYSSFFEWGMNGNYDNSLRKWYEEIGLYELGEFIFDGNLCLWQKKNWPQKYIKVRIYETCEN